MSSDWPILPLGKLTINYDGKRRPVKESERKPGPYPYYGASGVVDHVDGYLFDGAYLLIGEDGENMRTRQTPISGAVMPKLTQGNLNKILLACPPLKVQKDIVGVLGALDDRITLLRETNAALEAIAQALFKSWFVDFDPVRAKLEGRAPEGMNEATAALFSDGFEESELGFVPRGWRVARLDEFLELAYGKALKAIDRTPGDVPVYGSGGVTGSHNESLVNGPAVIIGRKGTVGSLYWEDQPFFPIDTVFYIRTFIPMTYCFYLLQTLGLTDMNTDAVVPGLNRSNVYRLTVPYSSGAVLQAFDDVVNGVRKRIFCNQQQVQTLATLRDTLLPRLISSRLRVNEIGYEN